MDFSFFPCIGKHIFFNISQQNTLFPYATHAAFRNGTGNFELTTLTNLLMPTVEPVNWPEGNYCRLQMSAVQCALSMQYCRIARLISDPDIIGIYGFGNSPRSKPFRKVVYGEKLFTDIVEGIANGKTEEHLVSELLGMAQDKTRYARKTGTVIHCSRLAA